MDSPRLVAGHNGLIKTRWGGCGVSVPAFIRSFTKNWEARTLCLWSNSRAQVSALNLVSPIIGARAG
jgi:hypothetical protein